MFKSLFKKCVVVVLTMFLAISSYSTNIIAENVDYNRLQSMVQSDEPINWLFTGDSITQGVLWTGGYRTYPEYFESYINNEFKTENGKGRENDIVINTGVSSATTEDLIRNKNSWLTNKKPDVVFITFGMNDARQNTPQVPLDKYEANIREAVQLARDLGAIPILQTENKTNGTAENANLVKAFDRIRKIAQEESLILIDINENWDALTQRVGKGLLGDALHPNAMGHAVWAQFLLEELGLMQDGPFKNFDPKNYLHTVNGPKADPSMLPLGLDFEPREGAVLNVPIEKVFTGSDIVTPEVDITKVKDLTSSNVTFRVKPGEGRSDATLFSLGNSDNFSKVSIVLLANGKLRINSRTETGADAYYTLNKTLSAGQWYTISVNYSTTNVALYVDGEVDRSINISGAAAIYFDKFDIQNLYVGGHIDGGNKDGTQFFKGLIDGLSIYDKTLTVDQIKKLTKDAKIGSKLSQLINNTSPNTWLFTGGETTWGNNAKVSTKNYPQLFKEVISWEVSAGTILLRSKAVINTAKVGLKSSDLVNDYEKLVGQFAPQISFYMPDLLVDNKLVEDSLESFVANVESFIINNKAKGSIPIIITPANISELDDAYTSSLRAVASKNDAFTIDVSKYLEEVYNYYPFVKDHWFTDGLINEVGQLEVAKYILNTLNLSVAPNNSRVFGLNYMTQNQADLTMPNKIEAARDEEDLIIDVNSIKTPYFIDEYTVYYDVQGVLTEAGTFNINSDTRLTNVPKADFKLVLVGNLIVNGAIDKKVNILSDVIKATPIPNYKITAEVNPIAGGTISTLEETYPKGTSVTITATPSKGYTFDKWVVGGETFTTSEVTFTVEKDVLVQAYFKARPVPNITELEATLASVKLLDLSKYLTPGVDSLNALVQKANEFLATELYDVEQSVVDKHTNDIKVAINNLIEINLPDTTDLVKAIKSVDDLELDTYLQPGVTTLNELVKKANDFLKTDLQDVKQSVVDKHTADINQAIKNLVKINLPDTTDLVKAIKSVDDLELNTYLQPGVTTLNEFVKKANDFLKTDLQDVKQSVVDKHTADINQAIKNLVKINLPDTTNLVKAIKSVDDLELDTYLKPGVTTLNEIVKKANDFLKTDLQDVEQSVVDKYTTDINQAIKDLVKINLPNTSGLEDALESVNAIDLDKYVTSGVKVLNDIVEEVKLFLSSDLQDVEQAVVDQLTKRLNDAIKALVEIKLPDISELELTLESIDELTLDDYKSEGVVKLKALVAEANELLSSDLQGIQQEVIDQLIRNIKDAIAALEKKGDSLPLTPLEPSKPNEKPTTPTLPNTGISNSYTIYLGMFVLLGGMSIIFKSRKRVKKVL